MPYPRDMKRMNRSCYRKRTALHEGDIAGIPEDSKGREYAEIVLANGAVLAGYVFVDATARIQDLLNGEASFFAFIGKEERIHLVNKDAIVEVRPFDQ